MIITLRWMFVLPAAIAPPSDPMKFATQPEASLPPSDHQMIVSICEPGMSCRLIWASHHLASCVWEGGSPTKSAGLPVMS